VVEWGCARCVVIANQHDHHVRIPVQTYRLEAILSITANTELIGPIPTGRGLERVAWWVIGTWTEAERQELRAGTDLSVQGGLSSPNSCLEPETGKPHVMGSESNDWLAPTISSDAIKHFPAGRFGN
jgi:hypothetical protein